MDRTRDESKWIFTHHPSVDSYLQSEAVDGAHSIKCRDGILDLLVEDRQSDCTLIVFTASVPSSRENYPVFSGMGLARAAKANLISVTDPAIADGVNIGWHLGTQATGQLQPTLTLILNATLERLESSKTILFGASGGGFSAVQASQGLDDCMIILVNPRLDLLSRPPAQAAKFLRACWGSSAQGDLTIDEARQLKKIGPTRLAEIFHQGPGHPTLIYQNVEDSNFLAHQVAPFVKENWQSPNLFLRFEHDGAGHVRIPHERINGIIGALCGDSPETERIKNAGFTSAGAAFIDTTIELAANNPAIHEKNRQIKSLKANLASANKKIRILQRLRKEAEVSTTFSTVPSDVALKQQLATMRRARNTALDRVEEAEEKLQALTKNAERAERGHSQATERPVAKTLLKIPLKFLQKIKK